MEKQISINGRNYYFDIKQDANYPRTHVYLKSDSAVAAKWIANANFDGIIYSSIESLGPSDYDVDAVFRKMIRDAEFSITTQELGIIEYNEEEE